MENVLNFIMPIVIGVVFGGFLIFQIFSKPQRVKRSKQRSVLYYADSTNSGTPARDVFESMKEIEPNYLGMRDYEL